MVFPTFFILLFTISFTICLCQLTLQINNDNSEGNGFYSIKINSKVWLSSGQLEAYLGHKWYTANSSVVNNNKNKWNLMSISSSSTQKNLNDNFGGKYDLYLFEWKTQDNKYLFNTNFKIYSDGEAISFQQSFSSSIDGTNYIDLSFVPKNCDNFPSVVPFLSFPSFSIANGNSEYALKKLGFLTWHNTFSYTASGLTPLQGGEISGVSGGPVVLFDADNNALLISSNDHFATSTASNMGINNFSDWSLGIAASVLSIPSNFTHETVIVFSSNGINDVLLNKWSNKILSLYPTERVSGDNDILTSHLGYWTDNGAYYYAYNFRENLSCCDTDTFINVKKTNIDANDIKIHYWQMDDWWMPVSGLNSNIQWAGVGALKSWYPKQPYFAGGLSELSYSLNVPLALYGPYFSPENIWINEFEFIPKNYSYVLPSSQDSYQFYSTLFDFGMNESTYLNEYNHKGHGMIMYEVDFMSCLSMTPVYKLNIGAMQQWLSGMNVAAKERNIIIQYCMASPQSLLSSLTLSQVTNGRASWDYASAPNYNIGQGSLLWSALKLKPSKDNFWSTFPQAGPPNVEFSPYGTDQSSCETHALIAILSTGPVGFSDSIAHTNSTIIKRTIRQDGRLLQPNRAITAIDDEMILNIFDGQHINVWNTQSGPLNSNYKYYINQIVLALDMRDDYVLNINSFSPKISNNYSHFVVRKFYNFMRCKNETSAIQSGCIEIVADANKLYTFRPQKAVKPSNESFELVTVVPINNYMNEILFIGEINKYVSCSQHRFSELNIDSTQSLSVNIKGDGNEMVEVSLLNPIHNDYILYTYHVVLDQTGQLAWKINF